MSLPPPIPDHELFCPIAQGAYGEVWLARNAVGTWRAVKLVRRDLHGAAESFEREFTGLQKFEPVSRTHEGLVDILTMGLLPEGAGFYYVMELADNVIADRGCEPDWPRRSAHSNYQPKTLRAQLKARGAWPAQEVVALGMKVAAALAHLHASGLVHRDVKPSNILFIGGEPKLADAGLVAEMDDARSLVGTAGYIAPEGPGTPQADLYALGKVLYEAAFGKDRKEFPSLPADVASRTDHGRLLELNEIIATACAHDPKQRYPSATIMAVDLGSLHAGHSIKWHRGKRQALNHVKKAALAMPLLAIAVATILSLPVRRAEPHPMKASRVAEAQQAYSDGYRALHAASDDGPARAIAHFRRAIDLDPKFAAAYVRLAQANIFIGGPGAARLIEARTAVSNALALDPKLSEAHAMLSTVKRRLELDWSAGKEELELALRLNPNSPDTLYEVALCLAMQGRGEEAVKTLERAVALDPESASVARLRHAGHVYTWSRQYDRGIEKYNEVIKNVPSSRARMEESLVEAFLGKRDYRAAIEHGRNSRPFHEETPEEMKARYDALQKAFEEGGEKAYWERALELETSRNDAYHLMRMAAIFARLDRRQDAFRLLDKAYHQTPTEFAFNINTDPSFDSLHSDRQWTEMMNKLWRKK